MPTQQSIEIFVPEVEAFGGGERSVLALSRWLHVHGIPNRILTYEDRVGLENHVQHALQVVQLRPARGVRAKVASLKRHFADHGTGAKLLCSGYQPALHATLAGIRGFHCLMHDTPALFSDPAHRSMKNSLRTALTNFVVGVGLRSGGATVVTSEFLKEDCRKDFGIQAQIARMGGLPSPAGFVERPFQGALNMLSISRIEANKRIDWMLEALAKLEHARPSLSTRANWRLDIAGKGSLLEPLRAKAQRLGLADRVHFPGFVSDRELGQLLAATHLFLMPAVQGFGIPAVEALQAGIPVLLHRESGVSDILLETPWATVFTGGEDAMTQALDAAIGSVMAGRQLGQPLPPISTEDDWAEQIVRLCGWAN